MKATPNTEVEHLKQLEKELELENLRKERSVNFKTESTDDLEALIKSVKTLCIPVPTRAESFHLFFLSLEKAFEIKNVSEELISEILLNILEEKVNNLMIISEGDLKNTDILKAVVTKEFQTTLQD
ncbi:DUF1758 domain-containing protein [Caerostris extrusa]|uniref:DUF1758 domain-containing protein n=1 Tax=Caerostris extrusa TaxID=172846 RepID=A0AAV4M528_CAEEX|nr:DUF1758 domain-containing protein [Caerostris extrusa]